MALVVFNGHQYDDQALPAHVDPDQCVPIDEWFRVNRRAAAPPKVRATKPAPKAAPTPESEQESVSAKPAARSRKKS